MHKNTYLIIFSLLVVIVVGYFGWRYLGVSEQVTPPLNGEQQTRSEQDSSQNNNTSTLSEIADEQDKTATQVDSSQFQEMAVLEDVTGTEIPTGEAYARYFEDEGYFLYARVENVPPLEDGYFYEGWVVRSLPFRFESTGALELIDEEQQIFVNQFSSETNFLDHGRYVLTLEPDDGDPAPADHIVEGDFRPL